MHICIVGTGAAGWISAFMLKKLDIVDKITIVGSPAIPTIGVGESNTMNMFNFFHKNLFPNFSNDEILKFFADIDAAIKYGVYYQNWSNKNFLHAFVGHSKNNCSGYLLGNLSGEVNENHYMMPMYDQIVNDNIFIRAPNLQQYSFHFDANKFIATMKKLAEKESKIHHVKDTVVDAKFNDDESVSNITLSDRTIIEADYYVSCVGQRDFNERVFKEEYVEYSDVLLTNKALFYPLEYTDKERQFHPYTVAKAMKHGWRWITPTWSRIGTGYVFSTNHVSIDEATHEFQQDIGDNSIEPFITDFFPRRVKKVFKKNYCSIGMAGGFLEPLDAPGLSMTINNIGKLQNILNELTNAKMANNKSEYSFNFWASFILHQYKTATRSDTQFWFDHKNVKFEFYDELIQNLYNPIGIREGHPEYKNHIEEPFMFYNTAAGKGHRWPVKCNIQPKKYKNHFLLNQINFSKVKTHYEFFNEIHQKYRNSK